MKETLFVCLVEENSSSYAAIMKTFQMTKLRRSFLTRSMPLAAQVKYGSTSRLQSD
jgi:hypothetical protein